jgi:oligoendopeptidase F
MATLIKETTIETKDIKTEWDLEKFYFKSLDDPKIQEYIDSDKSQVEGFIKKYKGRISGLSDQEFFDFMNESDSLMKKMTRVYYYYSYLNTLDTQDQEVLKRMGVLQNLWSDVSESLLFINEEYKEIGYEKLIERSNMELFSRFKNDLYNSANELKYMLTEKEERVFLETGKVSGILSDIYTELTNSFEFEYKGEKKTEMEIYALRLSKNEEDRAEANRLLHEEYGKNQIVLGNIYKSVCKKNVCNIKLRGYDGVMQTRNLSEEMDNDVVNKMIEMVKSNYPIFHRHLKNKAKILGKDKLDFHDTLAPIPSDNIDDNIPFNKGFGMYLNSIKNFDKEFYDYSVDMFSDGRVSVYPKQGKMGGAYASYNKDKESFVMLNHTDDFQSIMTLAHELGHAIHGWYSQKQPGCVYHAPLSLAETASIFNETFVFEEFLKDVSEEDANYYIMRNLDDIFSTMFRQIMYIDFERECHQRFLDGEELSYEDFNEIWLNKSKEYYGDGVNIPEYVKYGWSVIPHIFQTPFYCYAYSFGNILSFNLYQMYKDASDKSSFVEMYKGILRAGGSMRPKDLLSENSIDITSDEFYKKAFEVIENFIGKVKL